MNIRLSGTAIAVIVAASPLHAAAQQPVQLDTLHVSVSSRLPAASALRSVDIIDRAMIERLHMQNLADVIARALGTDVQSRSPAQADLALRGSTTEQVLILIDGVPVNDTQTGHLHLDQAVPIEAVERIEVLRGAASALYGSGAFGGIVNIVTRTDPRLGARAEAGSSNSFLMSATAGTRLRETAPLTASIERSTSDGHRAGTDYETTVARASFMAPAGGGSVRADVGVAERAFGAAQFYAPFPTAFEKTRVLTGAIAYERLFGRVSIEPRASIRRHHDDFVLKRDTPSFYHNVHAATDAGGGVVIRIPAAILTTALGGETYHSSIRSTNLGDHDETRGAVFGEAVAGGEDRGYTASAGLRLDHSSTFGDFLSPSFAAGLQVGSRLHLRASAARAFRAPTWTDRYYSDPANRGDSTLAVERAWSYEAGAGITAGHGVTADITGFRRTVTNAIDWVRPDTAPASTPWQIVNIQDATFDGAELALRQRGWLGADWTLRASALSFTADGAAGLVSKYALRPITRTAALEVAAPLVAGLSLGLRAAHLQRTGESAHDLVDAQITWDAGDVALYVAGTNLGDAAYLDVSAAPAPGRAFFLGARWSRSDRSSH
jgi:iron complex outermembrane receptor protein